MRHIEVQHLTTVGLWADGVSGAVTNLRNCGSRGPAVGFLGILYRVYEWLMKGFAAIDSLAYSMRCTLTYVLQHILK